MRRLVLFLVVFAVVLASFAALTWWVDPFGQVWKPAALAAARNDGCLLSEELVGNEYYRFKLAVFRSRPTRTFVVGSSRVLKIAARPGETTFSNLGYPGTAPATILKLFRALPARPVQTVYLGVESFWFNRRYVVPDTDLSLYHLSEYLISRSAVITSYQQFRLLPYVRPPHRWRRVALGTRCTLARGYPAINWELDGSRMWSFEVDPGRYPPIHGTPLTGHNLDVWRNGYYADWRSIDRSRVAELEDALALARARGWRVVGFAPPEPANIRRVLRTDPRIAPRWLEYLRLMPQLFHRYGDSWIGLGVRCPGSEFPDEFHSDAECSARLRDRLDEAARRLH
jgi:hypothetical protein